MLIAPIGWGDHLPQPPLLACEQSKIGWPRISSPSCLTRNLARSFARAPPSRISTLKIVDGSSPLVGSRRVVYCISVVMGGSGKRMVTECWSEDAVMVVVEDYNLLCVCKVASWFHCALRNTPEQVITRAAYSNDHVKRDPGLELVFKLFVPESLGYLVNVDILICHFRSLSGSLGPWLRIAVDIRGMGNFEERPSPFSPK
jgi:hypothetical protein